MTCGEPTHRAAQHRGGGLTVLCLDVGDPVLIPAVAGRSAQYAHDDENGPEDHGGCERDQQQIDDPFLGR